MLPVVVSSELDVDGLLSLCAIVTGMMPTLNDVACVSAQAGRVRLGARMELSDTQIEQLADQPDVLAIDRAP
jgi:hypothetical protein